MRPAVLAVFADALGPDAGEALASRLGVAHAGSLQGVLGYSSGALPTVLTGASPRQHGRMCLFARWDGEGDSPLAPLAWLGLVPSLLRNRPRVRQLIERWFRASTGRTGYFSLGRVPPSLFSRLDDRERDDMFNAASVGGHRTFLHEAREAGLEVVASDWRSPEARRADRIVDAAAPDLAFLYLSGLDALLHERGALDGASSRWLDFAAREIDRSRRAMGRRARQVVTLIVGDHGMAKVDTVIDPRPVVRAIEALDRRAFAFVDASMLRVSVRRSAVPRASRLLSSTGATVLDSAALSLLDAPDDGSYGDLVAVLPEGAIFAPSYVGGVARGMHGYLPTAASARAAIVSDAPLPQGASSLVDFAPWVRSLLELPATSEAS